MKTPPEIAKPMMKPATVYFSDISLPLYLKQLTARQELPEPSTPGSHMVSPSCFGRQLATDRKC